MNVSPNCCRDCGHPASDHHHAGEWYGLHRCKHVDRVGRFLRREVPCTCPGWR